MCVSVPFLHIKSGIQHVTADSTCITATACKFDFETLCF